MRGYLPPSDSYDVWNRIFYFIINAIGQLMVVMFLFYSGYGIMESFRRKDLYTNTFITHRVLKTLFNFDIAVLLFLLLALIIGKDYDILTVLLSLIGWESIGNSNWFVFDIIVLYLMAYLVLIIKKRYSIPNKIYFSLIYTLCFTFIIFLYVTKHNSYWFDTVLSFPTGMLYSEYKDYFEKKFKSGLFWPLFMATSVLFVVLYRWGGYAATILNCVVFSFLFILISVKIRFNNIILRWLGINCFAIYILQRIPMIVYTEFGLNNNWVLFSIAVIPTTLLLAAVYTAFTNKINKYFF